MDCPELLDALRRGEPLDGPEAAAHLAACPDCAELAREASGWTTALEAAAHEAPALDVAALQVGLNARLRAERGALGWLRSRPTWLRRGLVLTLMGAYPLSLALYHGWPLREDLPHHMWLRFASEAALLAGLVLAGVWTALRPLQRPAASARGALLALLLAPALAATLALLPQAHHAPCPEEHAAVCFRYGVQFGLPLVALALLVSRWLTWPVLALAGVSAGVFGDLILYLICPDPRPGHVLMGHASVVAMWSGAALLGGLVARALRRGG